MRYVEARIDEYNHEETYRIYIAKSLQLIPQNKYIAKNYTDLIKPQQIDTRSGDQIVIDIMRMAGLKFGE